MVMKSSLITKSLLISLILILLITSDYIKPVASGKLLKLKKLKKLLPYLLALKPAKKFLFPLPLPLPLPIP